MNKTIPLILILVILVGITSSTNLYANVLLKNVTENDCNCTDYKWMIGKEISNSPYIHDWITPMTPPRSINWGKIEDVQGEFVLVNYTLKHSPYLFDLQWIPIDSIERIF